VNPIAARSVIPAIASQMLMEDLLTPAASRRMADTQFESLSCCRTRLSARCASFSYPSAMLSIAFFWQLVGYLLGERARFVGAGAPMFGIVNGNLSHAEPLARASVPSCAYTNMNSLWLSCNDADDFSHQRRVGHHSRRQLFANAVIAASRLSA
jgi:hypothetical protein